MVHIKLDLGSETVSERISGHVVCTYPKGQVNLDPDDLTLTLLGQEYIDEDPTPYYIDFLQADIAIDRSILPLAGKNIVKQVYMLPFQMDLGPEVISSWSIRCGGTRGFIRYFVQAKKEKGIVGKKKINVERLAIESIPAELLTVPPEEHVMNPCCCLRAQAFCTITLGTRLVNTVSPGQTISVSIFCENLTNQSGMMYIVFKEKTRMTTNQGGRYASQALVSMSLPLQAHYEGDKEVEISIPQSTALDLRARCMSAEHEIQIRVSLLCYKYPVDLRIPVRVVKRVKSVAMTEGNE